MTDLPEQHHDDTTTDAPHRDAPHRDVQHRDETSTGDVPTDARHRDAQRRDDTPTHDTPGEDTPVEPTEPAGSAGATSTSRPAAAPPPAGTSESAAARPPAGEPPAAGPPPAGPAPAWPQQTAPSDSERRNWAVGAHLAALVASVFTGLAVLGPLIVYLVKKDDDTFIAEHAREALNFQLTWLIGGFVGTVVAVIITVVTVGFGLIVFVPAAIAFAIAWLVFVVLAAMAASRGEYYRYPLTVRLVS